MKRGAAGQLAFIYKDDIRAACPGKVIGDAGTENAPTYNNDLCLISHYVSPFIST